VTRNSQPLPGLAAI